MTTLRTDAWLLRGISSIPGELSLSGSLLAFTATNSGSAWPWQLQGLARELEAPKLVRTLNSGGRAVVFRWTVDELNFWVPWYYFGGGMKIQRGAHVVKLSFGAPADTGGPVYDAAENLNRAATNVKEVGIMRSRGALWSSALSSALANADDERASQVNRSDPKPKDKSSVSKRLR